METFLGLVAGAAGLYATMVGTLAVRQRQLLYRPGRERPVLPVDLVPGVRGDTIRTEDGLDLLAWFAPPAAADRPIVLYLHGNGGTIGHRANRMARTAALGCGVLLPEYRGFGGNPGSPTETGLRRDVHAAYRHLRDAGIAPGRIVLWGESLGTALAARLAAEVEVGGVILQAPFPSIVAVAQAHYPYVPVGPFIRDRFEVLPALPRIAAPVLVMMGERDEIVPPPMSRQVFAALQAPKSLWAAPAAGHNDMDEHGAPAAVAAFLEELLARTSRLPEGAVPV